jgi:NADPH:quinone reductase-like Zn-dependent oxidoreductase
MVYESYGGPEVLQLREVRKPVPGSGDILIKVRAVEVTKSDCEMRSFRYPVSWFWLPMRIAMGIRKPRRLILGFYFAGEIEAVGDGVREFSVGDEVFGSSNFRLGAYAEYLKVPASFAIIEKPKNMGFTEAAAVPLGGWNALHFMNLARLEAGDEVLINGAGGSIGCHAIQIARARGARVTAVDGAHKEAAVRALGAADFIDYRLEDFSQRSQQWDVIFDMVPGSPSGRYISRLKPDGCYLTGNPTLATMLRCAITNRFTGKRASFAFAKETREALKELKDMIEAGEIGTIVETVLPLMEAAAAHRRVESEERLGAVVLQVG